MMIEQKPFYFIRHGQTDWNVEHRAMGATDIALNHYGVQQSQNACRYFKDLPIKTVCCSPLKRARQTAEILNQELQCEMVFIEDLKEFCLGTFAGKIVGDWFDLWLKGANLPKGETFKQFISRSLSGVNAALSQQGPVLIVAHGGTYWAIQQATQLLDLPDLPNCTLVHFSPPKASNNKWTCSKCLVQQ